jgi:hypothetical protein
VPTARALVVSLLIALAAPSIARADRPPRGEIALTDLTVDVAVGAGVAFESPHLVIAGVTAYALAAPALHAAHGDAPGAGVSLALRVGLPLVIGLPAGVISARRSSGKSTGPGRVLLIGAAVGAVGAQLIDALLLAGARDTSAAPRMLAISGAF